MSVPTKYKINEIFYSVQGEGANTGLAAVFIRFAGCNLKCPYCDTKHQKYKSYTADEICAEAFSYNPAVIIFTGGEPMLQVDDELLSAFTVPGIKVAIETNGTIKMSKKQRMWFDWITCSPKPPKYEIKVKADEYKVVWSKDFDTRILEKIPEGRLYLQPDSNKQVYVKKIIDFIMECPEWRLSLQCQKLINIR